MLQNMGKADILKHTYCSFEIHNYLLPYPAHPLLITTANSTLEGRCGWFPL